MLLMIFIVFLVASFIASNTLKRKFKKYSQIPLSSGLSGAEIAQTMLNDNGIYDVRITSVSGQLTDHYNPVNKTVNLSENVYHGRSAAAAAVAAHECGHAVQHAKAYAPLKFRTALVPLQNVSARLMNIIFIMMIFGSMFLGNAIDYNLAMMIIIGCYGVFTLFSLVTLPVEFDASNRALAWIENRRIASSQELYMAKDALKWAASTYVIAALSSLATLLYYLMHFLGNQD